MSACAPRGFASPARTLGSVIHSCCWHCSVAAFGSGIVVVAAAAVDDIVVVYLEGVVVVVPAVVAVEGVAAFERW